MAAVVGKIIISYVASRLASEIVKKVADEVGMDEKDANVLGSVAGAIAGAYTYGAIGESAAAGGATEGATATPLDTADVSGAPKEFPSSTSPAATSYGAQVNKPGLLTGTPEISGSSVAPTTVAPVSTEAAAEPSFWEKMMNSEKTTDIMAATAGGMAQGAQSAGVAEDAAAERKAELEYERNKWNDVDVSKYARLQYPTFKSGGLLKGEI